MSDDLSDKLREWRELAEAATPGPWCDGYKGDAALIDASGYKIGRTYEPELGPAPDAAFIAAAREAVPALLDANAELTREVERLRADSEALRITIKAWSTERDAL